MRWGYMLLGYLAQASWKETGANSQAAFAFDVLAQKKRDKLSLGTRAVSDRGTDYATRFK